MLYRDLFLSSSFVFFCYCDILWCKIQDTFWGFAIFTVNCWCWVCWHLENELLWKNPGKTNQWLLREMLNWHNIYKESTTDRQIWFHRTLCLRKFNIQRKLDHIYLLNILLINFDIGCSPCQTMFNCVIQSRVSQILVKYIHILIS